VDQLLIFGFYARKNTLSPALVGVLSVGVYLMVALALLKPLGLYSLMIADSIKHMTHAGVMAYLLYRQLGGVRGQVLLTSGKAILASLIMGLVVWGIVQAFPGPAGTLDRLAVVGIGGAAGLLTYALLIGRLRVPEAQNLRELVGSKIKAMVRRK
jgi:putative peptidoglycan lipid II flippase